jgi:phosphomannomutase
MSANNDERKYFIELNNKYKYKEKLLELLLNKAEELKIIEEIDIVEGGSVGIAIYPKEYDKVQVVDHLINNYDIIHYFGDKYLKNGNDYNLLNHRNIRGHRVNNYNDTIDIINILKKFLPNSEP